MTNKTTTAQCAIAGVDLATQTFNDRFAKDSHFGWKPLDYWSAGFDAAVRTALAQPRAEQAGAACRMQGGTCDCAVPEACESPAATTASASDVCAEMRALCSACGGTGDVHSIDGEWRGSCDCDASSAPSQEAAPLEGLSELVARLRKPDGVISRGAVRDDMNLAANRLEQFAQQAAAKVFNFTPSYSESSPDGFIDCLRIHFSDGRSQVLYREPKPSRFGAAQAAHAGGVFDEQEKVAPPFAAPAGVDKDAWAEMVGEVAELYGRLLAKKREAHIEKGRDRGMAYYIADGIQWAVGELQRRCRAQGGETKDSSNDRAAIAANTSLEKKA